LYAQVERLLLWDRTCASSLQSLTFTKPDLWPLRHSPNMVNATFIFCDDEVFARSSRSSAVQYKKRSSRIPFSVRLCAQAWYRAGVRSLQFLVTSNSAQPSLCSLERLRDRGQLNLDFSALPGTSRTLGTLYSVASLARSSRDSDIQHNCAVSSPTSVQMRAQVEGEL